MTESRNISNRKPLKLDELKRDSVFSAPDGYFDRLPSQIQARIKAKEHHGYRPSASLVLRYALPIVILAVVMFQLDIFSPEAAPEPDALSLINDVSTQDLIAYLDQTDLTTEEFLDEIDLNRMDLNFTSPETQLLDEFDLESNQIDEILKEYDIEGDYL